MVFRDFRRTHPANSGSASPVFPLSYRLHPHKVPPQLRPPLQAGMLKIGASGKQGGVADEWFLHNYACQNQIVLGISKVCRGLKKYLDALKQWC